MKIKKLFSKTKQQQQKTLMKETKEDTNRLNDIPCSLLGYYSTQDSLQIQCNPYQITNGIFHRICLEKKKIQNSQSHLEKGKCNWRNQAPWLQTKCQSYTQEMEQHGTGIKREK